MYFDKFKKPNPQLAITSTFALPVAKFIYVLMVDASLMFKQNICFSVAVASETAAWSNPNFLYALKLKAVVSSSKAITGILTSVLLFTHWWTLNKFYQCKGTPPYLVLVKLLEFEESQFM